jgi:hypothetical protein
MTETEHDDELTEPSVTPVPEPDQELTPEVEEAEAEHNETQDADSEPEAVQHGPTQEEMEKRFAAVERRFKTYTDAVSKIWEEDALHLLPFQVDPGAPPGFIDLRNKGRVDDETKTAALAFLGFDQESGMNADPHSHTCEVCEGWGLVTTGSKVPNNDTRICIDCKGLGYVPDSLALQVEFGNGVKASSPETMQLVPAATGVESPEVESLRLQGYTIIPPMRTEP